MVDHADHRSTPDRGLLIAMAGLPGTGKSTIAAGLARRLNALVLSKDAIRAELFSDDEVRFTREQDDLCMRVLFLAAEYILIAKPEQTIIIDGRTFSRSSQVRQLLSQAEALKRTPVIIECVCPEAVALQRIEHDRRAGVHPAANRTRGLYAELKAKADPIGPEHLTVDTGSARPEECVERCLASIRSMAFVRNSPAAHPE